MSTLTPVGSAADVGRMRRCLAFVRQYGLRRCAFRVTHDLRRRSGLLKRHFPAWRWEDRPLASWLRPQTPSTPHEYRRYRIALGSNFFFPSGRPPAPPKQWTAGAVSEARELLQGRFRYFSSRFGELGSPPDWFLNPFTGQRAAADPHWCDLDDFEASRGDVKYIWEPSRFSWAYALARAYASEPCEEFAQGFWRLLESWMAANPPQIGPNWMCGQEVAIRLLACLFALHVLAGSPETTDERFASLVVLVAASAERIAGNIDFARAQMGNHAVSEAAGLWTVGVLFPELKHADTWRKVGRRVLEDEVRQFNYSDGSYTQHSTNYQRLMLHNYVWCLRLGELNGEAFSPLVRDRISSSYRFLYELQDPAHGQLPNYGPNDGALILPLSSCRYRDYRPVLGAAHYLFTGEQLYETGPWSEEMMWLFGDDALRSTVKPLERSGRAFQVGGYYTLRGRDTWGMVRCHSYRSRPNQADMLHLDVWWRGLNLLRDSGSFTYYDPECGWNHYFVSTAAHNTVEVGGVDQMIKGPRFQWYSLLRSQVLGRRSDGEIEIWAGEHDGYTRLVSDAVHRRAISRVGDRYWLVIDDVLGAGDESVILHWQLPDVEYEKRPDELVLRTPGGSCLLTVRSTAREWIWDVYRGVDEPGRRAGWDSQAYGIKEPALTVQVRAVAALPVRFCSVLALDTDELSVGGDLLTCLECGLPGAAPVIASLKPPRTGVLPMTEIRWSKQRCELAS